MKINFPKPGSYVLAVSGGVDSVVLLDILARRPELEIIVAHFNHHIRSDSDEDEKLVADLARKYGSRFVSGHADLGITASEAQAREARYDFLRSAMDKYNAQAIITAHHEDDLIETAALNILRGTGPRGVVAIASNKEILRPFLKVPKVELRNYAETNGLTWREDSTNGDESILRNYVRANVLAEMSERQRTHLLNSIDRIAELEEVKDELIATLSQSIIKNKELDRSRFSLLPFDVGSSLLHDWLRKSEAADLNRQIILRLNNFVRTGRDGAAFDVDKNVKVTLYKEVARLRTKK